MVCVTMCVMVCVDDDVDCGVVVGKVELMIFSRLSVLVRDRLTNAWTNK